GIAFIEKLQPVTYNMDITGLNKFLRPDMVADQFQEEGIASKEAIRYTGFLAQDVEAAARELGYDFSGVDAPKNEKDLYGLRYAEFVVPLVKAVQELSQKNEQLEQKIARLESLSVAESMSATDAQVVTLSTVSLLQNAPNPFKNRTLISYTLPQQFGSAKMMG